MQEFSARDLSTPTLSNRTSAAKDVCGLLEITTTDISPKVCLRIFRHELSKKQKLEGKRGRVTVADSLARESSPRQHPLADATTRGHCRGRDAFSRQFREISGHLPGRENSIVTCFASAGRGHRAGGGFRRNWGVYKRVSKLVTRAAASVTICQAVQACTSCLYKWHKSTRAPLALPPSRASFLSSAIKFITCLR